MVAVGTHALKPHLLKEVNYQINQSIPYDIGS